jgi:cytochrome c553
LEGKQKTESTTKRRWSRLAQGRQIEIQKELTEIAKKGAEGEQVMDRRISGGKLERYYFQ